MINNRNKWTDEEIEFIKNNYKELSDEELSKILTTHSPISVSTKRKRLGLTKNNRKYTFNDVIKEFSKTEYVLLSDEQDYVDSATKSLRYLCPYHLDKGEMTISLGHLQSGRGCYYCGRIITENAHIINCETNELECRELCISKGFEYVGITKEHGLYYIEYICPKHKEAGVQKMRKGNMKRDNIIGCPYCFDTKKFIFSKGEKAVGQALNDLNINYLQQYCFYDCRDKNLLPFDFYIPNKNKCIEYDGQHHYFPVNFCGISDEDAFHRHIMTIKHDNIKNEYCKNNNIELLRIPYYDFTKINEIVRDFIM